MSHVTPIAKRYRPLVSAITALLEQQFPSDSERKAVWDEIIKLTCDRSPRCGCCGTPSGAQHMPDPYAHEIYDDATLVWLCSRCAYEKAGDV